MAIFVLTLVSLCALSSKYYPDFRSMCVLELMVKRFLLYKTKHGSVILRVKVIFHQNGRRKKASQFFHVVSVSFGTVESPLALYSAKSWVGISSCSFIIFPPHSNHRGAKFIARPRFMPHFYDIPNLFYRSLVMKMNMSINDAKRISIYARQSFSVTVPAPYGILCRESKS